MPVLPGRNKKPLDLGVGRMSASIMPDGHICSVNTSHSQHGFITLTHIEKMPDGKRYDTEFVRSYRRRIAVVESGFGLVAETDAEPAAFLTDLNGQYQFYHDANDLPTVHAPLWGFCEKNAPHWLGTMEFAFTTASKGGYYPGRYEGLGSVHTPHKWPLGDGQELLYAWMSGDAKRLQRVLGNKPTGG